MLDALSRPSHLAGGGKGRGVGKTNKHSHSRMADPVGGRSTRTLKLVNLFLKLPTTIVHVLQHANWLINHYPASTRFRWRCWWEAGKALQDFFFPLFRYNAQRLIFPAVFCFPWPALSHTPKHFPLKIKAKKKKSKDAGRFCLPAVLTLWDAIFPRGQCEFSSRELGNTSWNQAPIPFSGLFRTIFLLLPHANSRLTTARRSKQADSRLVLRRCCFCWTTVETRWRRIRVTLEDWSRPRGRNDRAGVLLGVCTLLLSKFGWRE